MTKSEHKPTNFSRGSFTKLNIDRLYEIVVECEDIDEFDRTPEQQAIVELAEMVDEHAWLHRSRL